jgi:hypothetical protein
MEPKISPTPAVMGNSEAWRMARPEQPAVVLVKNATLWTAGPQGIMEGDLLVRGGRITSVGKNLTAPAGARVIDGRGKHVAPGILDEHSHSAILGNVNECTNSVTCEVRIQDVVNSESRHLYYQLAGGTTIMHLLHGSCNAIGGQLAVIKNKWGEPADRLVMANVAPTVKFALGENKRQLRRAWAAIPEPRRGQTIRDSFAGARLRATLSSHAPARHPPRRISGTEAGRDPGQAPITHSCRTGSGDAGCEEFGIRHVPAHPRELQGGRQDGARRQAGLQ